MEDSVECPYCEHEIGDLFEFNDDNFEIECDFCEKKFNIERNTSVSYSASVRQEDCKHERWYSGIDGRSCLVCSKVELFVKPMNHPTLPKLEER